MRLNSRLFFCLLAASCALSLLCERSDVITGVGGGVVGAWDSTLTNTAKGFALITLDASAVESAFSLPGAADPAVSTQAAGYALAGVNGDGDTLAAHVQYRITSLKSTGSTLYAHGDALEGAWLYFRAADAIGESSVPIAVYRSDTLVGLMPVNAADRVFASGGDDGESFVDNRIGEFTLAGAVDSVCLPDGLAKSIFDTRLGDSSAAMSTAFSVLGYDGELRKIHNPYIVVIVEKDGKTVRDSISGFVRFTAFERDGALRAKYPYSSQHTLRTAVFRVNLGRMVDTLGSLGLLSGGGEVLNAVIAVQCNRDSAAGGGDGLALQSSNIGNYKAVVLDTLLTNEAPADSTVAAALHSLRGQFSAVSSSAPDKPFNVHTIKALLGDAIAIEKHGGGNAAARYIYVYLRPVAENSSMLWNRPPMVEAVFTPSRSQ